MWNKLQYDDFMNKITNPITNTNNINKATGCNNLESIHNGRSNLLINKASEIESFYSLPGIPLSDSSPITKEHEVDFGKVGNINTENIYNKNKNFNPLEKKRRSHRKTSKSECHDLTTIMVTDQNENNLRNLCQPVVFTKKPDLNGGPENDDLYSISQVSYARAADNLKSFLETNKTAKDVALTSFYNDFQKRSKGRCEKSMQTCLNSFVSDRIIIKMIDKANQTKRIFTRNSSVSTDVLLMRAERSESYKNELAHPNIYGNKRISDEAINHKEKPDLKKRLAKNNSTTCPNTNFSTRSNGDESINNDSYLEEVTVLSKPILNFSPINHLFDNSILHLDYQREGLNINTNQGASFWDNLLERSEIDKSCQAPRPLKSLKPRTILTSKSEYLEKGSGDHKNSTTKDNSEKRPAKFKEYHSPKSSKSPSTVTEKNFSSEYNHQRKLSESSRDSKFARTFYLHRYDDLVKSHFCSSDRRIKSVSAKNNCSISIDGPITSLDNHLPNQPPKANVIYRCTVAGNNQENLNKCFNYLKETFPNTCLRSGIKNVLK